MVHNGNHSSSSSISSGSNKSKKSQRYFKNQNAKQHSSSLEGECPELKNHVYTYGDVKQADRYHKTTEVILNHIQKKFDHGQDTKDSLIALVKKDLSPYEPAEPPVKLKDGVALPMSMVQGHLLAQRVKNHVNREAELDINFSKAYALILGQCTQGVKNRLECRKDWININSSYDPIALLQAIKSITLNYQDSRYHIATISTSLMSLFTIRQYDQESLTD